MSRLTRWFVATAAVLVLAVFAFPLWRVTLEAPQYPEGIGMLIHVDGVSGVNEHDLDNINGLNHYIGMARIEPDAIPELRFMPWIAIAIAVSGVLVALRGSRAVYIGWASLVLATLGAGVYDFWRWEYDYGHDLNPEAAIRIPGLTYQPPLFGSKQILNFVAHSYPAAGGWALIFAGTVFGAVLAWLLVVERRPRARPAQPNARRLVPVAVLLLGATWLVSCARPGPRPIANGRDECAQCRMMITDPRFGGEVLTGTGRIQTFDAIECLAAYVATADPATVRGVWVMDFEHPGRWIAVDSARIVHDANIGSPMGRSMIAIAAGAPAEGYGGTVTTWQETLRGAR